jgi:hypothetical protein
VLNSEKESRVKAVNRVPIPRQSKVARRLVKLLSIEPEQQVEDVQWSSLGLARHDLELRWNPEAGCPLAGFELERRGWASASGYRCRANLARGDDTRTRGGYRPRVSYVTLCHFW